MLGASWCAGTESIDQNTRFIALREFWSARDGCNSCALAVSAVEGQLQETNLSGDSELK